MEIRTLDNLQCPHKTFVALGTFDGLHLGHRAVIETACGQADLTPVVFSVVPPHQEERLLTKEDQEALLSQMGVAILVPAPLTQIGHLSPEEFVQTILLQTLNAAHVVCGFNFRFGNGAAGDTALLQKLCRQQGIDVTVVPPVTADGQPVSSSRIRQALREGDIALANALSGHSYGFRAPVLQGQHLGRELGFPTINQALPKELVLPKNGVYAVRVTVANKTYGGVCNLGRHPTVGALSAPLAETYLIDFEGDLYGQTVRLEPIAFLRAEETFDSLHALQQAIAHNVEQTRDILQGVCYETV